VPSDKATHCHSLNRQIQIRLPGWKAEDTTPPADDDKKEEKKEEKTDAESLKEGKGESTVVLVGDADLIFDQFCAQVQEFLWPEDYSTAHGNLPLAQSMVEQLAGDSNLIAVRSRATMNRPFTVVRQMQADAQNRYRAKISEWRRACKRLNQTERTAAHEAGRKQSTIRALAGSAGRNQEVSNQTGPGQQGAAPVAATNEQEIDSLETRLKWLNIASMPLLVAISGISLAMVKRKRLPQNEPETAHYSCRPRVVVRGLGLMLSKRDAASWNRNEGGIGQKLLGDFPLNDVLRSSSSIPTRS
jgi:ABC-type uncharacterized transport system involved in gliding motility auxiliary subunit